MYLNKCQIIGNLTRDPELKMLPSGSPVCNISVATNHNYKDANGNKQEQVEFHSVTLYGKSAEAVNQYCFKGSQIYVEGRLQTRSWEKDGQKHYKTEIVASNFQFGNKPKDSTGTYHRNSTSGAEEDTKEKEPTWDDRKTTKAEYPANDDDYGEIPF